MMSYIIVLAVCLALVNCEPVTEDEGVMVLTLANFEEGLKSADSVLVEFYAPWCGHCKALEPEYKKAAKMLAENKDVSAKLAKVDATVDAELAKKHKVSGYPTIKFFRSSGVIDYSGGRKAEDIVAWILKKTGPSTTRLDTVEEVAKLDAEQLYVVAYFEDGASGLEEYERAAEAIDDVKFTRTSNKEVAKHLELKENTIVIFRKFDEPRVEFTDTLSHAALVDFVKSHQVAYVTEFSDESAPKIFGSPIRCHCLLFCKKSDESHSKLLEQYTIAAKSLKGKTIFIFIDTEVDSNERVLEFFNIKAADGTQLRVFKTDGDKMEKYNSGEHVTEFVSEQITQFVSNVLDGKIKKHLNTEEVPEDWDKEHVKVLVGKNYDDFVNDVTKDVLVEFYAPWCGHCKALTPIYDQLAEHYKDNEKVAIAKIDATKNEVESYSVRGFPTIILVRSEDNKIIAYNGGRTYDEMKAFVDSRGENQKAEAEEDDEGAEEEEEEAADQHEEL